MNDDTGRTPSPESAGEAEHEGQAEDTAEASPTTSSESKADNQADKAVDETRSTEAKSDDDTVEPNDDTIEPDDDTAGADDNTVEPDDGAEATETVPEDVRKYERFTKMDGAQYDRVNEFLRDRTYITAREWAIARLCSDFRTETGVEMTKIGENLPRLVPFMTDTYTPQAVNQARSSFEGKVTKSGATFLYGAMSGFFTAEELDELMYEVTEVAKFLLEVEGVDLAVADELDAEERISSVMREVRAESAELRAEEVECPHCGETHSPDS